MILIVDMSIELIKKDLKRLLEETALISGSPYIIYVSITRGGKPSITLDHGGIKCKRVINSGSDFALTFAHANEMSRLSTAYPSAHIISSSRLVRECVTAPVYQSVSGFAQSVLGVYYPDTTAPLDRTSIRALGLYRSHFEQYTLGRLCELTGVPRDKLLKTVRDHEFERKYKFRYNIALDLFQQIA